MPKKLKTGKVVSDKMDKTVVVAVAEYNKHPKYGKIIATTKNYKASDIQGLSNKGDEVRIIESRPVSKDKRWSVVEVVKKAT